MRFRLLSAVLFVFLLSCGKELPTLEGVDTAAWKKDNNGCSGARLAMIDKVKEQKGKLLALDEVQLIRVLGRPDRNELFKRNQKFYYYFVEPSEKCQNSLARPKKLVIRFNAVGLAKEVVIE